MRDPFEESVMLSLARSRWNGSGPTLYGRGNVEATRYADLVVDLVEMKVTKDRSGAHATRPDRVLRRLMKAIAHDERVLILT